MLPVLQPARRRGRRRAPVRAALLGPDARAWIYDFGLRLPQAAAAATTSPTTPASASRTPSPPCGPAQAEIDGFNALVLRAGLTWRQAMVLRAYAKYLRQAGSTFSQEYMEDTLRNNVHITRLLVSLFEARMSPGPPAGAARS